MPKYYILLSIFLASLVKYLWFGLCGVVEGTIVSCVVSAISVQNGGCSSRLRSLTKFWINGSLGQTLDRPCRKGVYAMGYGAAALSAPLRFGRVIQDSTLPGSPHPGAA